MLLLVMLTTVFVLSAGLTYAFRLYALRVDLLDVPNARSSHERPTPRGGGVSIVVVALMATAFAPSFTAQSSLIPPLGLLASAGVAAIGYWDDRAGVPARWRFAVHVLAAMLMLYALGGVPALPWWGGSIELGLAGVAVATVGIVWLINLYNFMDGIDGIAAVEALTVLVGAMAVLLVQGRTVPVELPIFAAAAAGFLVWNWPPARIFMGDAASGFLGALLGLLALVSSNHAGMNLWCWAILLAVFITDATLTLLRRMARGECWYRAHRTHAYQRLSRRAGRHWPVTVGVAAVNLLWLAPLAGVAAASPSSAAFVAMLAYSPLVLAWWRVGGGLPEKH